MTETFRRTLRGAILSSEGFSVRLSGRSTVLYSRGRQEWRFGAEAMAGPGIRVVLHADTIPSGPELDRLSVVRDIERAFQAMGWDLMVDW